MLMFWRQYSFYFGEGIVYYKRIESVGNCEFDEAIKKPLNGLNDDMHLVSL